MIGLSVSRPPERENMMNRSVEMDVQENYLDEYARQR
jgi:hypothetical protein